MMQELALSVKEDFSTEAYEENWMIALDFRKLKCQMKITKMIPITKVFLMTNIFMPIKNLLILNISHFYLPTSQKVPAVAEFLPVCFL